MEHTRAKFLIEHCGSCNRMYRVSRELLDTIEGDKASQHIIAIHEENGHAERELRLAILAARGDALA